MSTEEQKIERLKKIQRAKRIETELSNIIDNTHFENEPRIINFHSPGFRLETRGSIVSFWQSPRGDNFGVRSNNQLLTRIVILKEVVVPTLSDTLVAERVVKEFMQAYE